MKKYKEDIQKLEGPAVTESAALHGQCAHFWKINAKTTILKVFLELMQKAQFRDLLFFPSCSTSLF